MTYSSDSSAILLADSLHVGHVQVDPRKNVSRAGRWLPPDHPRVRKLVEEYRVRPVLEPVGLRLLDSPVPRPCGCAPCCSPAAMERDAASGPREHLVELRYGFARFSALLALGHYSLRLCQPAVEATIHETMTDDEAAKACLAENLVRWEPSDCELAIELCALFEHDPAYRAMRPGERNAAAAREFNLRSANFVEEITRIVRRCPQDLLDEWESRPDRETRQILFRVTRVDPDEVHPEADRHEAMRQTYQRMRAEADERKAIEAAEESKRSASGTGEGTDGDPPRHRSPRIPRDRAERLLGRLDLATEAYDDRSGKFYPLSDEGRAVARAVLRYLVSGGRGGSEPVR